MKERNAIGGIDGRTRHVHVDHEYAVGIEPKGQVASRSNVPTKRPAATMSTIDNATWATTRPLDRPVRASPNAPRPCSLSASIGATRLALKAGAVPNSTAVAP